MTHIQRETKTWPVFPDVIRMNIHMEIRQVHETKHWVGHNKVKKWSISMDKAMYRKEKREHKWEALMERV